MTTRRKVVQFRRGTTQENDAIVGAEGELTIDLDKKTLVVHDGVRMGGYPLRREDATFTRQSFLEFKTAVVQNNIAFLGLSTDHNPPTAVGVQTTSGVSMAVARFDPVAEQSLYGRFAVPFNWPGTAMFCKILWRTEDVENAVSWRVEAGGLHDGLTIESFEFTATSSTFAEPSTVANGLTTTTLTLSPEQLIHVEPSGDFFFKVSRGFDSSTFPADVISVRFNLDRRGV